MQSPPQDFSHPALSEQVTAIGGSYVLIKEVRQPFADDELLYLVGAAIIDTSCCGAGGCAYALVPGFVREWKYKYDAHGRPVSLVSPVTDDRIREKIRTAIMKKEFVHQVSFI